MTSISKRIIYFILLIFVFSNANAQEKIVDSYDDIVFKALKDEIDRDMDSLRLPDHEPPFYMAFTYSNSAIYTISASLGAILQARHQIVPSYSSRLMIGDYDLTDENFESSSTVIPAGETGIQIDLPKEPDYYGIRRAVWSSMESLYRSANMHYKIKMAFLQKNHIKKEDYFPADFSMEKARILLNDSPDYELPFDEWKEKIKRLSNVFLEYPDIQNSDISLNAVNSTIYYVNSEGFEVKTPYCLIAVQVDAGMPVEEGEAISETLIFSAASPSDLPSYETMEARVREFAEYILRLKEAPILQEKYSGPVIFTGDAAGKYIFHSLYNNRDALVARRIPLEDNSTNLYMPTKPPYNSIEAKIGKKIFHPHLSVLDISQQKSYNGEKLFGYYPNDADGIVPQSPFVIVEKGVLKGLFNGRIPSLTYSHSNGHTRHYITSQGMLGKTISPGVLKVSIKKPLKYKKLVKQAKSYAKMLNLKYYLLVKNMFGEKPVGVYKVDVKTGKETLIRGVDFIPHPIKSMDERLDAGEGENVVNAILNVPVSIIAPSSILIPKVEIFGVSRIEKNRLPVLPSPMKR